MSEPSEWKRDIIANNLYGVDIKPEAIEIAKLRMWLSLVVDIPNIEDVEPLPNLDYKLMCGDSLISTIHGEQLIPDPTKTQQGMLAVTPIQQAIQPLLDLEHRYFDAQTEERHQLREQILAAEANVFRVAVGDRQSYWLGKQRELEASIKLMKGKASRAMEKEQKGIADKLADLNKFAAEVESGERSLNFFQYHLHFRDVFESKGGFDVVIGNPPYGAAIDDLADEFEKLFPETTKGFKDIYKLFIDQSLSHLLKAEGLLTFITPNTFLLQPRYKDLRRLLLKYNIKLLIDLGKGIFDAVVLNAILLVKKFQEDDNIILFSDCSKQFQGDDFLEKIKYINVPQKQYLQTKENLFVASIRKINEDERYLSDILQFKDAGINYQRVNVGLQEKGKSDLGQRLLYEGIKESEEDVMYWKGTDINEYYISHSTHRFVRIKTIKNLNDNERVILNKNYFEVCPKLIWRQTAEFPIAALDETGIWFGRSIQAGIIKAEFLDKLDYKYLLAILNSTYIRYLYIARVKEVGRVFPQIKLEKLTMLPIKISPQDLQIKIINLVDKILQITKKDNYLQNSIMLDNVNNLKREIDILIYKIYDLTDEEVAIIENAA